MSALPRRLLVPTKLVLWDRLRNGRPETRAHSDAVYLAADLIEAMTSAEYRKIVRRAHPQINEAMQEKRLRAFIERTSKEVETWPDWMKGKPDPKPRLPKGRSL